jgi:penicillin-binding protein 1A
MPKILEITDYIRIQALRLIRLSLYVIFLILFIGIFTVCYIGDDLPAKHEWEKAHKSWQQHLTFYDHSHRLVWQQGEHNSTPYSIKEIPDVLIYAFLASEDHRFFEHWGIDIRSLIRVIGQKLWKGGRLHGASTITQQVAKMWVGAERSFVRKIKEAVLAIQMEWYWNKYQILEIYLNHIYLGQRNYGVVEAAWYYLHKNLEQLSIADCALLASIPPRPSVINPTRNVNKSIQQRNHILYRMYQLELISKEDLQQAINEVPLIAFSKHGVDPIFAHYILTAKAHLKTLGIQYGTVELAMNIAQQRQAYKSMNQGVDALKNRQDKTNRKKKNTHNKTQTQSATASSDIQAALVTTRHLDSAIVALQGSVDFTKNQFNRVTQSCRAIGSTVKPWIYALALEKGWSYTQRVSDAPIAIFDSKQQLIWKPHGAYQSNGVGVRLNQAIIHSLNLPFIHLTKDLGLSTVQQWLQSLQMRNNYKHLSMALGASCMAPIQLNQLYASIPQLGTLSAMHIITKYTTLQNEVLWDHAHPTQYGLGDDRMIFAMLHDSITIQRSLAQKVNALNINKSMKESNHILGLKQVISPKSAHILQKTLHKVSIKGTAKKARTFPWKIAGKTGSTDLYDAWFTGYNSTHTTTVWVGSDLETVPLGHGEGGGRTALPIWLDFIRNTAHISPRTLPKIHEVLQELDQLNSSKVIQFPLSPVIPKSIKKSYQHRIKKHKQYPKTSDPHQIHDEILEMEGQF